MPDGATGDGACENENGEIQRGEKVGRGQFGNSGLDTSQKLVDDENRDPHPFRQNF